MDLPGLLTDGGPPRRSPLRWVLGGLVAAFLILATLAAVLLVRLKAERDRARARIEELLEELRRPVPAAAAHPLPAAEPLSPLQRRLEELEARLAQVETLRRAESVSSPTLPAPPVPREPSAVSPARPAGGEAMIYLHVAAGFAGRGLWPESIRALGEALRLDPPGTWRLRPRGLFPSPETFERLVAELERRVRDDPMDTEARTLLAYVVYYEKGAEAAKALLLQVLAASPEHAVAKRLLEEMER